MARCCLSICVDATACTWVYGNVKGYSAAWAFGSANSVPESFQLMPESCGIEHLADPAHEVFLPPQLSSISWNDSGTLFAEPKAHAAEYPWTLPYTQVNAAAIS